MTIDDSEVQDLIARRQAAERVVEGMPEGTIKEKAFEIVFQRLVTAESQPRAKKRSRRRTRSARASTTDQPAAQPEAKTPRRSTGPYAQVTELAQDGFFDEWKNLPEIQEQLRARGHNYKQSELSPVLLSLTQAKTLQRERRPREGGRDIWVYRKFGL